MLAEETNYCGVHSVGADVCDGAQCETLLMLIKRGHLDDANRGLTAWALPHPFTLSSIRGKEGVISLVHATRSDHIFVMSDSVGYNTKFDADFFPCSTSCTMFLFKQQRAANEKKLPWPRMK